MNPLNLPLRAWKEALATLGLSRRERSRKENRPRQMRRGLRVRTPECLEDRRMMAVLYFDPNHTATGNTAATLSGAGGSGALNTTDAIFYNLSTGADQVWNNANGDTAVFTGTAGTVTLDSGIQAGEVDLSTSGYTLTGGSLAISGTGRIDVAAGLSDTISTTLDGTNGLSKTGSGTLVLTGSNTYTGGTTIDSGGTLQLGDGVSNNGSVAGNIADNGTLVFANPNAQTSSGDISGGGAVTVNSLGVLTLTGSSSYSGTTTVSAGTLQAGAADVFSASSEYVVNDTLDLNGYHQAIGSLSGSGEVTNNSSTDTASVLTVTADSAGTEFDGLLVDGSGTLGLTVSGSGDMLKLGGYSMYSGATTVNAGATLQASESDSFSPESGFTVNGTLDLNGNDEQIAALTGSGTVENSSTGTASFLAVGDNGAADTFGGTMEDGAGVLGLVKVGSNTLTLSGTRSYSGGTTIDAGSVVGAPSEPASESVGSGDTLDLAGGNLTLSSLTGVGTVTNSDSGTTVVLTLVNASADTFAGTIEGNVELVFAGAGTFTLTGTNTYSGGTNIDGGALQIGDGTGSNASIAGNITDDGMLTFDNPSTQTYAGIISGWGGAVVESTAALTLSGASTYYGATTVDGGATLAASTENAFSDNSDYTILGTLDLAGYSQAVGSLSGSGIVESSGSAATLTAGDDGNVTEFTGTLEDATGTLALTVSGAGMLTLGGTSTYHGATTINAGAMLQAGAADALSDNSDFTIDATGMFDLNGFNEAVGSLAGAGTVTNSAASTASFLSEGADGNSTTFSGTIEDGSGVLGLIKYGDGTLTLSGTLTYSAGTTIVAGSIVGTTPANPASVDLASGETLDLDGQNLTLASLTGVGIVYNSVAGSTAVLTILNTSADTFGGTIEDGSGILAVTLAGSGTLTLSGTSSYSGPTVITSGTLEAGATDSLSDNSDFLVNSTLDLGGYSESIGSLSGSGTVTDSVPSTSVILTVGADGASTEFTGSLDDGSGTFGLAVTGAGGLTITGSDSYSGGTAINGGALQLGDGETANGSLTGDIVDNGTLVFANISDQTYSGSISGTGNLGVEAAAGVTLTLSGASTYSGETTVSSGTLLAGGNNVLSPNSSYEVDGMLDLDGYDEMIGSLSGSGTVTNSGSATSVLTVGGNDTSTTFSGILENGSGALALTKIGDGVFTLTASNTYTGATVIDAGTIELSGNNHQILNPAPSGYANGIVPADLGNAFNWTGITNDGDSFSDIPAMQSGGIDGNGNALSATLLGTTQTIGGVTFDIGASESSDVVVATGQEIDLPQGQFSKLEILAMSINGNQSDQTFTVNYTDGTSDMFTQSISDWTTPQSYSGETTALSMSYLNTAGGGTQSGTYDIYEYSFDVDATRTVLSITLPDNEIVMLLAATGVAPTSVVTGVVATPLSSAQIELSWTAPSGTVTGYNIFRGLSSGGENVLLNSTPLSATAISFIDSTVVPGNQYYYVVQAVNGTTTGPTVSANLTSAFNVTGIVGDGSTFSGGLDGVGSALSEALLGDSLNWNDVPFTIGPAGTADVVRATGQTVQLGGGYFNQLDLLATAVNGNQTSQTFTVNYTDGTSATFTQSLSDWYAPQDYSGESVALSMAYRDLGDGSADNRTFHVYGYVFDLDSSKAVASITLPNNANVELLAITGQMAGPLSAEASAATPTTGSTAQVDLGASFNHAGITTDGATVSGGLDGLGNALSGNLLGSSQTWNGAAFNLGAAGTSDVVQAAGQTIALPPGEFSQLELLATATNGNQPAQTFTFTYTDGTSQTFTQGVSDWYTPQGYAGESVAIAMPYRNAASGSTDNRTFNIYGYVFDLDSSKTVASITLPDNSNLFVLAATEHAANILPTGTAVNIADGALLELNGTDQQVGSLSGDAGSYVDLGGATLTVGSDNASTTFAGAIYGTGNLTKVGTGTLTLSGSDTHAGTTTVTAGTLHAGAADVFSQTSTYLVHGLLDLAGFDQTIGSLSGDGTVTNSGTTDAVLTTGGDNTSTTFSGALLDGPSASLGLTRNGAGTFILNGTSNYTGPTQISAGTLEVDNGIIPTIVTVNPGGTLQGSGGVAGIVNLGGTAVEYLYDVSILNSALQTGSTADASTGSIAFRDAGSGPEMIAALSPTDAAFRALLGSATNTDTSQTYSTDQASNNINGSQPSRPAFRFDQSFSAPGVSYTGQALAFEDLDGLPTCDYDYNDDFFEITVVRDTTAPYAMDVGLQDGVGGAKTFSLATSGTTVNSFTDPTNGTLIQNSDGTFTYTPNLGFFGTDSFKYQLTNGSLSNWATVTIQVLLPQIELLNVGTDPVLVSDDATDPTGNADSDHLDELQIKIDPDSVFATLPYNLTDWMLNLDAVSGNGMVEFWESLGKTVELDNAGTGDETWTFGSTIASADVPADVYVDVNADLTGKVAAELVAPSGVPAGPAQNVQVTAQGAKLIGESVNTSSGTMVTAPLPYNVQQTEGTYVPLSNESQLYNLEDNNGTLTADMNYVGAIPNDQFLMPFGIDIGTVPAYSDYSLELAGANIRVWQAPNRTVQVTDGEDIDSLMPYGGSTTFYIEGVQTGEFTLYLDAMVGGVKTELASLPVWVFAFTGPQDVPNYSTYSYGVDGLTAATSPSWSVNNQGTLAPATTNATASIKWGAGGVDGFGRASYAINAYYTWTYLINVVNVSVSNFEFDPAIKATATAGAFQTEGPTIAGPGGIESVYVNSDSNDEASEIASAAVTMVGPKGTMVGLVGNHIINPNGNWGVDQMVVGYIQTLEKGTEIVGNYGAYGSLMSYVDYKAPLLDTSHADVAWQFHKKAIGLPLDRQLIDNQQAQFWGTPVQIQTFDKPANSVPAFFNEGADESGSLEITSATILEKFDLYIDAGIKVLGPTGAVLSDKYTSLSVASWSWTASGTFAGDYSFRYTAAPADGVVGSAGWRPSDLSTNTLLPGFPTANSVGGEGLWVVQYNTD